MQKLATWVCYRDVIDLQSKIAPDGTIMLLGGSVGQDESNPKNLAQKIANVAGRIVIAPTCPINPNSVTTKSLEPLIVSHPGRSYIKNFLFYSCPENNDELLKTFFPK